MRVVAWNAKVGRSDKNFKNGLNDLIDALNPGVICLQEAKDYTSVLRNSFGNRFWVYTHTDWKESNDNPILVRQNYNKKERGDGWNTCRMDTGWEGPNGHQHPGRTWTYVLVDGIWIMSYHRVTGGKKKNRDAFAEEFDRTVDWINKKDPDGGSVLIVGDHNIGPKDGDKKGSKKIASVVSGNVAFDNEDPGIDYAIRRNQKVSTAERKGSYGSDHKAFLVVTPED